MTPPCYVVGPTAHVKLAAEALERFHSRKPEKRLEATIKNVMDLSMDKVLNIRRAIRADDCLKRAKIYDVRTRLCLISG